MNRNLRSRRLLCTVRLNDRLSVPLNLRCACVEVRELTQDFV